MFSALIAAIVLSAPYDGRFKRFESRKIEGRSSRGFLASSGSAAVAPYVPLLSFAPTGGAGLGGNCSCADVTDATGAVPLSMTRASDGFCGDETSQAFALCAVDKPRIINGAYLREPASTNYVVRTDNLTHPSWANSSTTLTAGQADPLGGTGATRVQTAACPTVGNLFVVYQSPGAFGTTDVSASVWVKEGSSGPGTAQMYIYGAGAGTAVTMAYDSTWRRYSISQAGPSSDIAFGCVNYATIAGSHDTGASDFLVFRPQYEDSLAPTSSIYTFASPVARAADSRLEGALPSNIGPGDFCVAASVQKTGAAFGGLNDFAILTDNATDDILAGLTSSTALSLASGVDSETPTVTAVSTTIHRLVWGNVGGVGSATWDLGAITPVPASGASQPNNIILIGSDYTLTSRVIIDTTGCQ